MSKYNLLNIKSYIVGNLRYAVYYEPKKNWLIRKHIKEQIAWRIKVMSPRCYCEGSCEICGCATPHLQMANKACDKPCYPTMMGRKDWKAFQKGGLFYDKPLDLFWQIKYGELINFEQKEHVGN